jgi:hypothetical protein
MTGLVLQAHRRNIQARQELVMQENPFAPHSPAPPEAVADRDREVDLIFGHVKAAQRGNIAICGPLGIGKTSLLRYIADPAVAASGGLLPPEYALLYVDVHSIAPFSAARFWHRVAQLVGRQPGVDLSAPAHALQERHAPDIVDLEEFLDELADRGTTLVLLLDEFEWVLQMDHSETESRDFLAQMASLARRTPRALSLVVATEAPLPEVTRVIESWRGSPFATIFTAIALKALAREDADHLFDLALDGAESLLSDEDRDLLYRFSGGQPAALQAAAFGLYHGRQHNLDRESLREAARAAAARAMDTVRPPGPASAEPARRAPEGAAPGGLWIDAQTGDVVVDGRRIESLTALEYNLLRLLVASAGRLCSKDDIIRQVWGTEFVGQIDDSRVEKLISRLRRKVESVAGRPQYIRTVRGRGYRYVP